MVSHHNHLYINAQFSMAMLNHQRVMDFDGDQ